jgi:adenine-specific DNA-methyltransferase
MVVLNLTMANNKKKAKVAAADSSLDKVTDYRFPEATRKNNPPAKIAAEGHVPLVPKAEYQYSPRRPPELRFDPTGRTDELPELLATARQRKLTEAEAWALAEALRAYEPWLEWAGKREARSFAVDPVALHIHERVSAQAILKVAAREDVNRSLFADPQQEYNEAVQFYKHDVDWSNRLILGDSLQVMSSLARREDLAGKVQMIYIDPPYGIRFASNFQPEVRNREVKDKESDLTREPEMVKAYRDTWRLGVHSYLAYLRDRLIAAKELLADTGSIFVQIGDENVHLVRGVLDEVFGRENFIAEITLRKTTSATNLFLPGVADYILWYGRNRESTTYNPVYQDKGAERGADHYGMVELPTGLRRSLSREERLDGTIPKGARLFTADQLQSASMGREKGEGAACWFPVQAGGKSFLPNQKNRWKTNEGGMRRLVAAERVLPQDEALRYVRYVDDFPVYPLNNVWSDIGGAPDRRYIVETTTKIVERCILMSTRPGDLVLDPTCGSGTTAQVAEQWGRRWITIDTSRVAVAIARQRLLTARYDYYRLRDDESVEGGFRCRTVGRITLKSIAQNGSLDPLFERHEATLQARAEAEERRQEGHHGGRPPPLGSAGEGERLAALGCPARH